MSKKTTNRLGKKAVLDLGLSELLSSCEVPNGDNSNAKSSIEFIKLNQLIPSPYQQRRTFCPNSITELSKTIEEQGILQPLVVRFNGSQYEIIAGERRWRAAKQAGLEEVPTILKDMSDDQAMVIGLIENLQREDLNIVDQALGIQALITDFKLTHSEISEKIGLSRQSVTNILRLLQLHNDVQAALQSSKIHFGHARCLVTLPANEQIKAMHKVIENKWSVRELESWLSAKRNPKPAVNAKNVCLSTTTQIYFNRLSERINSFSSKIRLSHKKNNKGGSLIIDFNHEDDLETLLQKFTNSIDEARDTKL